MGEGVHERLELIDAIAQAQQETGLAERPLPEACLWTMDQAADRNFWPE
jgi:hypothetical protein